MKYIVTILVVVGILVAIAVVGRKAPAGKDCCQVGNAKCASGVGVTKDYCEKELDGEFVEGSTCNTDTGQCE